MKSLVTRLNESSKLIVTGDVEQIDDKNLNQYNNGLVHLIEAGKDEDFIGHIAMDIDPKSKRGRLAGFGARKL
jgi:predicted ribonuclease YlaK